MFFPSKRVYICLFVVPCIKCGIYFVDNNEKGKQASKHKLSKKKKLASTNWDLKILIQFRVINSKKKPKRRHFSGEILS